MSDRSSHRYNLDDLAREARERWGGTPERDEYLALSKDEQREIVRNPNHRLHAAADEVRSAIGQSFAANHEKMEARRREAEQRLRAAAERYAPSVLDFPALEPLDLTHLAEDIDQMHRDQERRQRADDRRATVNLWIAALALILAAASLVVAILAM